MPLHTDLAFCCIKLPLSSPMKWSYVLLLYPAEEGNDRMAWWASIQPRSSHHNMLPRHWDCCFSYSPLPPKKRVHLYYTIKCKLTITQILKNLLQNWYFRTQAVQQAHECICETIFYMEKYKNSGRDGLSANASINRELR